MIKKSPQNTNNVDELLIYGSETNRYHYIVYWIQKFVKKYRFDNIAVTEVTSIKEFISKNLEKVPAVEYKEKFVYCKHSHVDKFLLDVAALILEQSNNDSIEEIDLIMDPENIDYEKLIMINNFHKDKAAYIRLGLQFNDKIDLSERIQIGRLCREQLYQFILFQGLENSLPILMYDVEYTTPSIDVQESEKKITTGTTK